MVEPTGPHPPLSAQPSINAPDPTAERAQTATSTLQPGKLRTERPPRTPIWRDPFLQIAVVVGLGLLAIWAIIPTPDRLPSERPTPPIGTRYTLELFAQIEHGMTYREVVDLLGEEGTKLGENDQRRRMDMYAWTNPDGSRLTVLFEEGEVVSTSELDLPAGSPR